MAVDDMAALLRQSEFGQIVVDYGLVRQIALILVLFFGVAFFLCQERALKGCHLVLAKERRIRIQPDVPHDIAAQRLLALRYAHESFADVALQNIIEGTAVEVRTIDLDFLEASVLI